MVFMGRLGLARKKDLNSKEKDASFAGKGDGRHRTRQWVSQVSPRAEGCCLEQSRGGEEGGERGDEGD